MEYDISVYSSKGISTMFASLTRRFCPESLKQISRLNLILILFYAVALILNKFGVHFLIPAAGLLIFCLPGINTALIFEQFSKAPLGKINTLLWAILITLFFVPVIYFFIFYSSLSPEAKDAALPIAALGLPFLSYIVLMITRAIQRVKVCMVDKAIFKDNKFFFFSLLAVLLIILVNFLLYRFIPEADPYYYLIKLRTISDHNLDITKESRSLFLVFFYSLSKITQIDPYWLFRVFPLFAAATFFLLFYKISSATIKNKVLLFLSSSLAILIPVIAMEMLITRPQSFFMIALPISLYFLNSNFKRKDSAGLFWIVIVLFASIIGLKFHELYIFMLAISAIVLFVYLVRKYKDRPLLFSSVGLLFLVLAYPWIRDSGLLRQLSSYWHTLTALITHPRVDLWFIDHYQNVDGTELGWPGLMAVLYYGYNLGILPLLYLIHLLTTKFKLKIDLLNNWVYWLAFLLFFSVAEIFPRLGLYYLPDRAWLFVAVVLCLLAVPLIARIRMATVLSKKMIAVIAVTAIVLSLFISWGLTYAKQGWTSKNEYEAAIYIKKNTPADSIFITQGGNFVVMKYFALRGTVNSGSSFFMKEGQGQKEIDSYFPAQCGLPMSKQNVGREETVLAEKIKKASSATDNSQFQIAQDELKQQIDNFIAAKETDINTIATACPSINRPIYILYSKDKFSSIYSLRDWWKKSNAYGADLSKLDANPLFEKIYDTGKVMIWKYEKTS